MTLVGLEPNSIFISISALWLHAVARQLASPCKLSAAPYGVQVGSGESGALHWNSYSPTCPHWQPTLQCGLFWEIPLLLSTLYGLKGDERRLRKLATVCSTGAGKVFGTGIASRPVQVGGL